MIIDCCSIKEILVKYPLFNAAESYSYGTAGFRCPAEHLKGIAARVGVLAALRSRLKGCKLIGLMITASHNPSGDNGVKLVDPDGGLLDQLWEPTVVEFIRLPIDKVEEWILHLFASAACGDGDLSQSKSRVVLGYDTRLSSPELAEEARQGILAAQGQCHCLGLVSTPQLHFCVQQMNQSSSLQIDRRLAEFDLDTDYVKHFAQAFSTGLMDLTQGRDHQPVVELNLDCANGVGAIEMERISHFLAPIAHLFRLRLHNCLIDSFHHQLLNHDCGADFVKSNAKCPIVHDQQNRTVSKGADSSTNERWASFDGDADRLVYFHVKPGDPPTIKLPLLDGDRQACLLASFFTKHLTQLSSLKLGVVQTAYANGASTDYLTRRLNLPVVCVATGVKHLIKAVKQFDIGIWFEANGHGTVYYSNTALSTISSLLPPDHPVRILISLTNTSVGDACSDLLMVEYVLRSFNWTLDDWANLYTDLASLQLKLPVADRRAIITEDAERRVAEPAALQTAIDQLLAELDQVTATAQLQGQQQPKSRAFVRPSGTEDVVRIYAESRSPALANWLARKIALATHRVVGGVAGGLEPTDPGPLPTTA